MEGLSGHISSRDGFSRHGPTLTATPEWADKSHANGYVYGEHDYRSHHSHHEHQPQQHPQQSLIRGGGSGVTGLGAGVGRGSGSVRSMQHVHQHPSSLQQQSDRHEMAIITSSRDPQARDPQAGLGADLGGPSRLGMSVQDLKIMTARRMAQQHQQGGQSSGSPRQSPPSTSQGQPSRLGLVHPSDFGSQRTAPAGPQHLRNHTAAQQQQQQQQQHQQQTVMIPQLSRHSSAQGIGVTGYSHQNGGGRPHLVVTQGRGPDQGVMDQHHLPQRTIHRGTSAPRLYSSVATEESNPPGRLLGHGLSVEELKEMTKLRLQHQNRASPPSAMTRSNSGRGGSNRVDLSMSHDRMEWRPTLGDRRGMVEEAPHGVSRRSNSLALAQGNVSRDAVAAPGMGRRFLHASNAGREGVGRMEASLILEDRMRALQSETVGGSPRILSQPSSPCYSQPGSPTSSPSHSSHNSPGRHHRGQQSVRRDGAGAGTGTGGIPISAGVGNGYPTPPPGFVDRPGTVQHYSLRLDGGNSGSAHGEERVPYLRRGASFEFPPAPSAGGGSSSTPMLMSSRSYNDGSPHVSPHLVGSSGSSRRGSPHMESTGVPSLDNMDTNSNAFGARGIRARSYDGRTAMLGAGRSLSTSVSPPGDESDLRMSAEFFSNGPSGHTNLGNVGGGDFDKVRRCSFDERLPTRWTVMRDGDTKDHVPIDIDSRNQIRHPSNLGLVGSHFDVLRSTPASATTSTTAAPNTGYGGGLGLGSGPAASGMTSAPTASGGGVRAVSVATKDAIPTQCAEFALLTPKRALVQQTSSASLVTWSTHWGHEESGTDKVSNGDAMSSTGVAGSVKNGRSNDLADSDFRQENTQQGVGGTTITSAGSLAQHGGEGSLAGSGSVLDGQASRGGSDVGSPVRFGGHGSGDEAEENGASSCSSGGGGRQHSVHAFDALDAAVGRGGGGGAEASSGSGNGSGFEGYAVGSGSAEAARNGGVEAEAQRFGRPVTSSAFFGEDLPDCAGMSLEGEDDGAGSEHQSSIGKSSPPLSGSSPSSLFAQSTMTVIHNRTPSPQNQEVEQQPKCAATGPTSDESLASAMQNQMTF